MRKRQTTLMFDMVRLNAVNGFVVLGGVGGAGVENVKAVIPNQKCLRRIPRTAYTKRFV